MAISRWLGVGMVVMAAGCGADVSEKTTVSQQGARLTDVSEMITVSLTRPLSSTGYQGNTLTIECKEPLNIKEVTVNRSEEYRACDFDWRDINLLQARYCESRGGKVLSVAECQIGWKKTLEWVEKGNIVEATVVTDKGSATYKW